MKIKDADLDLTYEILNAHHKTLIAKQSSTSGITSFVYELEGRYYVVRLGCEEVEEEDARAFIVTDTVDVKDGQIVTDN